MNARGAALLEPRLAGDIEGKFFVRDYQRGYRWGPDEVRRLLDDIKDAGSRNYYLQPVVVKRLEDDRWELVDGQQRLTTLYLWGAGPDGSDKAAGCAIRRSGTCTPSRPVSRFDRAARGSPLRSPDR